MIVKRVVKLMTKTAATIIMLFMISSQAYALSFANGGFEGFTGNTNTHNSQVPPGWTTTGGTPDTFDEFTNFGGYTWGPSTNGGDFLHGIGWQPTWTESAQQLALDGLVIGQQYEISFEQSISNSTWAQTGGFWNITFGSETQASDFMSLPALGVFEGWEWQTMMFTATATSQNLTVSAMSDTDYVRTDLGIDSFFLGEPGGNPDKPPEDLPPSVPEPASIFLLGTGIVGLAGFRRKKFLKK